MTSYFSSTLFPLFCAIFFSLVDLPNGKEPIRGPIGFSIQFLLSASPIPQLTFFKHPSMGIYSPILNLCEEVSLLVHSQMTITIAAQLPATARKPMYANITSRD